jgi:hypothetical protein
MQFLKNINYKTTSLGLFSFLLILTFSILLTLVLTNPDSINLVNKHSLVFGRFNFYTSVIISAILTTIAEELIFRLGLIKNNYKLRLFSTIALVLFGIKELFKIFHGADYLGLFVLKTLSLIPNLRLEHFSKFLGSRIINDTIVKINIWQDIFLQLQFSTLFRLFFTLSILLILGILATVFFAITKSKLKLPKLAFINSRVFGFVYLFVSLPIFYLGHINIGQSYFDIYGLPRLVLILWLYPLFLNKGLKTAILGHSLANLSGTLITVIPYLHLVSKTDLYILSGAWVLLLITFLNSYFGGLKILTRFRKS